MLDDHRSRKNTPNIGHKVFEQGIFLSGQFNPLSCTLDLLRQAIDLQIGDTQYVGAAHRTTPQQCLYSTEQFREGERLGEIVIGSDLEMLDLIGERVAGR